MIRNRKRLCVFCMQFSGHTQRCGCGRWHCDACGSALCVDCLIESMGEGVYYA